jgi:hypothetical protein
MVQKSFFHLLFHDVKEYANNGYFKNEVIEELKANGFKNDDKT